jgi:hypothetical protein
MPSTVPTSTARCGICTSAFRPAANVWGRQRFECISLAVCDGVYVRRAALTRGVAGYAGPPPALMSCHFAGESRGCAALVSVMMSGGDNVADGNRDAGTAGSRPGRGDFVWLTLLLLARLKEPA